MVDQDAKRLYQESVLQQSLEYDKQLVWLAAGAIALVVAFVTALKPVMSDGMLWFLGAGVFLLLVSMTITLTSFQVSIADSGAVLSDLINDEKNADDDTAAEKDRTQRARRMGILNGASLVAFVLGVVGFMLFAYLALPKG